MAFTLVVYLFAFAGGFVQTWGRDYTITLNHFRTAFALEWGQFGLVWAGTAWNSLLHHHQAGGHLGAAHGRGGLLIAWLLARTEFRGQGAFEFVALLAFAIPGTVLGVSYILAFNVPPFELTGTASSSCCASCSATCRWACGRARRPSSSWTNRWMRLR
jgi:iron(III) transport system permease protein